MSDYNFAHLEQQPADGRKADRVVIVLHGYGSNGQRSSEQFSWLAEAFPDAHLYVPDGTYPYVPLMDPKQTGMDSEPVSGRFVWYHRYSEATRQEGLDETRTKLDAYIDQCATANSLSRDRVALIGLSQGAITLLNCVPFFEQPVGVSIPHSGYLFSPDSLASRQRQLPEFKSGVRSKTPTCSIHGYLDFTLPWQTHLEAANLYDECGIPVEFHLLAGLKHADMESRSQAIATEFIRRHLG
jgi:phospholipase/carboxylesterase